MDCDSDSDDKTVNSNGGNECLAINKTNSSDNCHKIINKKKKHGIIYLSKIPKYMNITLMREIFSKYGPLGRVYLQLAHSTDGDKKLIRKKSTKHFTEGWIEFESKKTAKYVAAALNNTQISSRKRSKFYDIIWNIKYLPRFKWIHLSERLAYEKAVHKQRLNAEISQAKREINFFSYNVDRSKKLQKKQQQGESTAFTIPEVKQRDTDMEIRINKNKKSKSDNINTTDSIENRTQFLQSLFS